MGIQINRGVNWIMGKMPDSIINLLNAVMIRSSVVKGFKVGKHSGSDNHQLPRIAAAKKKRKRKIAYQSRRINRLRAA